MATKAELLAEAKGRNLDVSDDNTKAEIEDALRADGYEAPAAASASASADAGSFTNAPDYDPKGKGLDYGGDQVGAAPDLDAAAREKGYFGNAPGAEVDGDLTVKGVAGRDVVAEQGDDA